MLFGRIQKNTLHDKPYQHKDNISNGLMTVIFL